MADGYVDGGGSEVKCELITPFRNEVNVDEDNEFIMNPRNTKLDTPLDRSLVHKIKCNFPAGTKFLSAYGDVDNCVVTMRLKCGTKEEFMLWMRKHEYLSGITYRVLMTKPPKGKKVVFKCFYRCQHNTYPESHRTKTPHKKHTGCEAKMNVTIKAPIRKRNQSKDELRMEYPTFVILRHNHNHRIEATEVKTNFAWRENLPSEWCASLAEKTDVVPDIKESAANWEISQNSGAEHTVLYYEVFQDHVTEDSPVVSEASDNTESEAELLHIETIPALGYHWNECEIKLRKMYDILKQNFQNNPTEYAVAIDKTYDNFMKLNSTSSVLNALHDFGRAEVGMKKNLKRPTVVPVHAVTE